MKTIIIGLLIPFAGTTAGAACVYALKKELESGVQRALTGFAAGVMVAASICRIIWQLFTSFTCCYVRGREQLLHVKSRKGKCVVWGIQARREAEPDGRPAAGKTTVKRSSSGSGGSPST